MAHVMTSCPGGVVGKARSAATARRGADPARPCASRCTNPTWRLSKQVGNRAYRSSGRALYRLLGGLSKSEEHPSTWDTREKLEIPGF